MTKETYIDNYYSRHLSNNAREYDALEGDVQVDVCVIGGGLAGLNTALGLLERGKNAVVLESKRIGWGGSGRNGGFVGKGYAASDMSLLKKLGREKAQEFVDMTKSARQLIQSRIEEYNIPCGPVRKGVLTVSWRDNPEEMKKYVETINDNFDLGFEFLDRTEIAKHCISDKYYDGFFSPHDFQFMPLEYVQGLGKVITQKGGQIFEQTPALKIERHGAHWTVFTAGGRVTAKDVVLCCSIYVDGLDKRLANASFPVKTFVVATKPVEQQYLDTAIPTKYAIHDTRFCSDYYRVLPDNSILWGGRVALWDNPDDVAQLLMSDLLKVYPQLKGHVEADVGWSGELCYAPHKMPQIGQIEKGYWYNTGYGGHGLCPTTVGGEVVADAIANANDDYKRFEPFGLMYAGGHMGRYVAQMVYWWWRARDYLNV